MRLKNIKLAGFKSFVDPTVVPFPGNLTAIVGPNGCGKSNIIDAIRWVMGESSAKQLRGQSLDDVIFNGSTARKPVGQAAIELTFDNSDGTLEGQYASYSELGIRREITRDGQSNYYLNGARCRRKDIIDIFLGTGLGPRSYAIIEQGMISRVVEAKPEELRSYIEEAAGISKYKERRRETELRIQHTQDNLARLNDLRDELEKQLNHLQRQANAAERYTVLKQEERLLKAQIHALRWRDLSVQLEHQTEIITQYEAQLADALVKQQQLEESLVIQREQQSIATNESNEIQAKYYEIGSEITRLEQITQNHRERREQWQRELSEITQQQSSQQQQLETAAQQQQQLAAEVTELTPQLDHLQLTAEQSQLTLKQAEQALKDWQLQWDDFNRDAAQIEQQAQVEQTRIHHLEQRLQNIQQRITRLEQEYEQQTAILTADAHDELQQQLADLHVQHGQGEHALQESLHKIALQREQNQHLVNELDVTKSQLQTLHGQQASLEALQQDALGQREAVVMDWLKQQQLADLPRLAQVLQVHEGWEQAVETVLERYLQGVCIEDLQTIKDQLNNLPEGNLAFVDTQQQSLAPPTPTIQHETLLTKVKAPWSLNTLLSGIYIAESFNAALTLSTQLSSHESVITADGVWVGNGWIYISHKADAKSGVLQRERELNELKDTLDKVIKTVELKQAALVAGQTELREFEEQRAQQQNKLAELIAAQADLRAQQQVKQARFTQAEQRAQQINAELQDCAEQLDTDQQQLLKAQQTYQDAQQEIEIKAAQRESLMEAKNTYQTALDTARQQAHSDQQVAHQVALRLQAAKLQLETTLQTQQRLQQLLLELAERQTVIQQTLAESETPLLDLSEQLQTLQLQRETVEEQLNIAKQKVAELENSLRQLEKQRHIIEQELSQWRGQLEQIRLNGQEAQVRSKTLQEQILEQNYELETLLAELSADAALNIWEEQLAQIIRKIEKLGAINLAAIDEYTAQAERKTYLDTQYADLTEALKTLDDVMQKMDRETKQRFKETYDQINDNFQKLFPRLFGGGRATLEIFGDDLLSTGITMMAQPPGKRNSTIHLLSGGEKALTAIALVFSLFQLNPAPFCMLDEVDAPLDDANVMRFCNLVKEMSEKVQFIFISHNKLAIEMAHHLAGVTMHEAGVSRMVAVDVEEAIAMATA